MIPLHDDNPTELTPVVTIATIVTCVLVFLYQASLPAGSGDTFVFQYGRSEEHTSELQSP